MKEKRSLFSMIFGKPKKKINHTRLKMLNGYMPSFTSFSGEAYDSDVVRAAVDAIARNAAKLKPKHIRRVGNKVYHQKSNIERLLQVRPNPFMDAYTFFYKVITQLLLKNNSFIYVSIEEINGDIKGFYPINSNSVEFIEYQKELYIKFDFMGGQTITLPYENILHLRRFFYKHDLYGESSSRALLPTLELIHTTNEGIINAIKSSANLRGILKFTQSMLKDEDIKRQRDRFVTDYMDINNNGGIAALDAKADYIDLKSEPKIINKAQMEHIKQSVYDYFGVNEKIIQSKYDEDEWNAFYESVIEPLAVQMSLEFTSKLFTDREKGHGNEIIFEANRLQYASNTTKVGLIEKLIPMGLLTINEAREILNLAPVEGGDKRLQTLNVVNADKADEYQLGKEGSENE